MDDVKLCIGCKHYARTALSMTDHCLHPETLRPRDLVRGDERLTYCDQSRADPKGCGPTARWFEKREA